jgi:chemotaxis protein methyltransferase CheR
MIYFDPNLRARVHQLLHRSLSTFGFLAIGKKESIRHTPVESCFQELDSGVSLYRRIR